MYCVVANWIARHFGGQWSKKLTGKMAFERISASLTLENKHTIETLNKIQLIEQ
jgi:hypothetical protein